MALAKHFRKNAKVQYLSTAHDIAGEVKAFALDVPPRYYRVYVGRMVRCASKLCSYCTMLNRMWSYDTPRAKYRFTYAHRAEMLVDDIEDEIEQCYKQVQQVATHSQHFFNKYKRGITAKRLYKELQSLIEKIAPMLSLERRCLKGVRKDIIHKLEVVGQWETIDLLQAEEEALQFSFCKRVWGTRSKKGKGKQEE